MQKSLSPEGQVSFGRLRIMALFTVIWLVFGFIVPDFVMGYFDVRVKWVETASQGIGVLLLGGCAAYLLVLVRNERWLVRVVLAGMVFLLLTGGEVFLRPDFFEIYSPLTRMGLILTLFTNGTLVTDRIAERLAEAPPALTQITLYGATAATYEAVTGVPGGYARCCAGIEALLKQRVPFDLRTTITQQNAGELEAMRQMAHQWGVSFSGAWMLMQRRDGNASRVENCRLSARECVSLEAEDRASADEWIETASRDISGKRESNFNCQAGKSLFVVNSYGEMNLCVSLAKPAARPLDIGFRAAWEALQRFVDEAPPPAAACVACDARKFCPRCPAWPQAPWAPRPRRTWR